MALKHEHIALSQDAFDMLPEYSCSLPTGHFVGKQWKARFASGWWMGEYIEDLDPEMIGIRWRKIAIRQAGLKPSDLCNPDNWGKMLKEYRIARATQAY